MACFSSNKKNFLLFTSIFELGMLLDDQFLKLEITVDSLLKLLELKIRLLKIFEGRSDYILIFFREEEGFEDMVYLGCKIIRAQL